MIRFAQKLRGLLPRPVRALCRAAAGAALLLTLAAPATGQGIGEPERDDPAQDILIEGLGFAKLVLKIEKDQALDKVPLYRPLGTVLEKNLCWSGLFNIVQGDSRYCRPRGELGRVDMRLELLAGQDELQLSLIDNGPENLVLFKETLTLKHRVPEQVLMDLVNRLTERISGEPGLLGSAIAFVLRQPRYAKVIVATNTHGAELKLISHNTGINLLPKWAPSGLSMVYTVLKNRGTQVYYHDFQDNGAGQKSSRFLTPEGSLNTGGTFSPDGNHLVLTMSQNRSADLFSIDLQNDTNRKLTSRSGIETQAHWSRDGKKIVFVSDRTGTPQIYLLDMETNEDLRLTFDGVYNADPKWSADGQSILFTKRVNRRDQIHIMDQYGENVRAVTRGQFYAEQAEWSPDGRQIVFTSNRTGDFKLYIVSADGSNLRRLTRTPARFEESSPSWTHRKLAR
ncbi:MAG: hypothetical protein O7A69_12680 [SAR324 cluster bacterium]|nr:hypothetical protein [SAR324 cluster bacterium]